MSSFPADSPHHLVQHMVQPASVVGSLRCIDYNESPLYGLEYAEIQRSWEDVSYKFKLEKHITQHGVQTPIVVVRRFKEPARLVDGHHRAHVSYRHGLETPILFHQCDCPPNELDFFRLCRYTLYSVRGLQLNELRDD